MARKGKKGASQAAPDQSGAASASDGVDAGTPPGGEIEGDVGPDGAADAGDPGAAADLEEGDGVGAIDQGAAAGNVEGQAQALVGAAELGNGDIARVADAQNMLNGNAPAEVDPSQHTSPVVVEQIPEAAAGGGASMANEQVTATDVSLAVPTAAEVKSSDGRRTDDAAIGSAEVDPGPTFPRYGRLLNNSASALSDPSSGVFVEAGGSVRVYLDSEEHAEAVATSIRETAAQLGIHADKLAFVPA